MKKILITVKSHNDKTILKHYINKYFVCEMIFADDTVDALDKVLLYSPDVIIADTSGNGFSVELINHLLKNGFDIPIVALINNGEEIKKIINSGLLSFIPRPLNSFLIYKQLQGLFALNAA